MAGPSAVLHPPGRPHSDVIGEAGLETLTIEFDPQWLRRYGFERPLDRSQAWQGGPASMAARRLATTLSDAHSSEAQIGCATSDFLHCAIASEAVRSPAWLATVKQSIAAGVSSANELARRTSLHPAWLARAYRHVAGEGLQETARRLRVEQASTLLRHSDLPLADVALASGFCDQGHMNRCFRALLGRTPLEVRTERLAMAAA